MNNNSMFDTNFNPNIPRKDINWDTVTEKQIIHIMSENHLGAYSTLCELKNQYDKFKFKMICKTIDDMNIRGQQIFHLYFKYFKKDIHKFVNQICNNKKDCVYKLNEDVLKRVINCNHLTVENGATGNRKLISEND